MRKIDFKVLVPQRPSNFRHGAFLNFPIQSTAQQSRFLKAFRGFYSVGIRVY